MKDMRPEGPSHSPYPIPSYALFIDRLIISKFPVAKLQYVIARMHNSNNFYALHDLHYHEEHFINIDTSFVFKYSFA
jgi:hypothetical protein